MRLLLGNEKSSETSSPQDASKQLTCNDHRQQRSSSTGFVSFEAARDCPTYVIDHSRINMDTRNGDLGRQLSSGMRYKDTSEAAAAAAAAAAASNRHNNNHNTLTSMLVVLFGLMLLLLRLDPATSAAATTTFALPDSTITTMAIATTTRSSLDTEDLPTRIPLNRFRPTRAPSSDPQSRVSAWTLLPLAATSRSQLTSITNLTSFPAPLSTSTGSGGSSSSNNHITSECLECICEASTNCNPNSRCQTSDVRHTRCGMFLISYDQWLETGLSKELVTPEALAQDAAADERAFYECVTNRDCAERLLTIYAHKHARDCDKDGRIDCYDMAAVHQGGLDGCQSEALLDSQYWSDFNACFGFGR